MSWQDDVELALVVIVSMVAVAGIAMSLAIFLPIIRQGGFRLAEPSIIKGRWQMIRPWLLAGAVIGLFFGIAIVFLSSNS